VGVRMPIWRSASPGGRLLAQAGNCRRGTGACIGRCGRQGRGGSRHHGRGRGRSGHRRNGLRQRGRFRSARRDRLLFGRSWGRRRRRQRLAIVRGGLGRTLRCGSGRRGNIPGGEVHRHQHVGIRALRLIRGVEIAAIRGRCARRQGADQGNKGGENVFHACDGNKFTPLCQRASAYKAHLVLHFQRIRTKTTPPAGAATCHPLRKNSCPFPDAR
jgi:hypothetical protein